ncbi:MAG: class III extradiol ring-cleavage dioxygenase [Polyangiaceae bacterium]
MTQLSAPSKPHPVLFVAHGAPVLLEDADWMAELRAWGASLPKPKGIVVISAHWEQRPVTIGATSAVPLVYDFYGFPEHYYRTQYPAPPAPALAERVRECLRAHGKPVAEAPRRGLDHGAYVPLLGMYPAADIPVLQVSMPVLDPIELIEFGKALAPLRSEGILIMGSGFLTHNLRFAFRPGTPDWAKDFDAWVEDRLLHFDVDALADFLQRGPSAKLAHPTWEHYAPLLVSLGASTNTTPEVTFPISGWWMDGAFTKRSVQFESGHP